jgi:hypothetical protein
VRAASAAITVETAAWTFAAWAAKVRKPSIGTAEPSSAKSVTVAVATWRTATIYEPLMITTITVDPPFKVSEVVARTTRAYAAHSKARTKGRRATWSSV